MKNIKRFLIQVSITACLTLNSLQATPPLIIGIYGGSGSGKSTFTRLLCEFLDSAYISADRYYKHHPEKSFEELAASNFDEPNAVAFDELTEHIKLLKQNAQFIHVPLYNFTTHKREPLLEQIDSKPYIIVEGIMLGAVEELRDEIDLLIFIDCNDEVRRIRRIRRDTTERGRSIKSVESQWLETVLPMHYKHVEPYKEHAHLILSGHDNETFTTTQLLDPTCEAILLKLDDLYSLPPIADMV